MIDFSTSLRPRQATSRVTFRVRGRPPVGSGRVPPEARLTHPDHGAAAGVDRSDNGSRRTHAIGDRTGVNTGAKTGRTP